MLVLLLLLFKSKSSYKPATGVYIMIKIQFIIILQPEYFKKQLIFNPLK